MYVAVGIQSILIMPQPQENFENYTLEINSGDNLCNNIGL